MAMRGSASLTAETILCQYGTKRHAQLHKVLLHQLSTTISVVKQRCLVVVHFLQQGFFCGGKGKEEKIGRHFMNLCDFTIAPTVVVETNLMVW